MHVRPRPRGAAGNIPRAMARFRRAAAPGRAECGRSAEAGRRAGLPAALFFGPAAGGRRAHARRLDGAPFGVGKVPAHVLADVGALSLGAALGRAVHAEPAGPPVGLKRPAARAALEDLALPRRARLPPGAVARIAVLPARVRAVPDGTGRRRELFAARAALGRPAARSRGPPRDRVFVPRIALFPARARAVPDGLVGGRELPAALPALYAPRLCGILDGPGRARRAAVPRAGPSRLKGAAAQAACDRPRHRQDGAGAVL